MKRRITFATALCGLLLHGLVAGADEAAPRAENSAIQQLERAQAEHPGDPDLAWALVRAFADSGDSDAALNQLEGFLAMWPKHRSEAHRLHGRLLYEKGLFGMSVQAFDAYLRLEPEDPSAHFYRGLALRGMGRRHEAATALTRAAQLDPSLLPDSLALRGLDRLAVGDQTAANRLVQRALKLDPTNTTAAEALPLLASEPTQNSRLKITARAGFENDDNLVLDSGLNIFGAPRDEDDVRALWGAGISYRLLETERSTLTVGYRYDETDHVTLSEYDTRSHMLFASSLVRLGSRAAFRLDGTYGNVDLGGKSYAHSMAVQPNFF